MTVPLESKKGVLTTLFPLLRDHTIGNVPSLAARGRARRRLRVPRRPAADAAVRPRRRDRDLRRARDHAQRAPRVDEDRARRDDALARAGVDRAAAGDARRAGRDRGRVRLPAQPPRAAAARLARGPGGGARRRRATSTGSGSGPSRSPARSAGFAGGLLVHQLGSITTEQVYLELTFLTLAMLVVGGMTSLWGAVVGALAVSGLDSFLSQAEQRHPRPRPRLDLPSGTRLVMPGGDHGARADPAALGPHRRAGAAAAAGAARGGGGA